MVLIMKEDLVESAKVLGVNGGVLAFASMAEVLDFLRAILLLVTIAWTAVKLWKLIND